MGVGIGKVLIKKIVFRNLIYKRNCKIKFLL